MGRPGSKNYLGYYLAIIFVIVLVLLPTHQARAAGWLEWGFEAIFANVIFIIFTVIGKVIGVLAVVLNWVIHIRVYPDGGVPVIDESWKIMRNFANMFFIIALIVMAFATIFDVMPGAAKYNVRSLFPRFLISALLINFSLVLGVLVIDASQILSNTFLTAIGDIGNRLGQDLNPSQLLPSKGDIPTSVAIDSAVFGTLVKLIFAVILLFTFLFSILTAVIFAFIRIPILWALLVVSPIAWILNVFPAGQNTYKKWWSLFIGWNAFLPIFLFFLYFGLYFLSNQGQVMQKIAAGLASAKPTSDLPFNFQLLFFYVLAAVFLIGGTIVAMKAALFSGTGVVGAAKWARGVALKTRLPYIGSYAAWQRGAQQKWQEMQKEGYGVGQYRFGGEKALETEALRRARMLGTKGAFEKGVETEKEKQKPFANNINELRRLAVSGSREQQLAARARLVELGDQNELSATKIKDTYRLAGGERSELANKILGSVDQSKLDEQTRKELSNWDVIQRNIELFKKNAMARIEKDKLTQSEIEQLVRQLASDTDRIEFLNKGAKKNFLEAAKAKASLRVPGVVTEEEARIMTPEQIEAREIRRAFDKITGDQILELEIDKIDKESGDYSIVMGQLNRIFADNPSRIEDIVRRANEETRSRLDEVIKTARGSRAASHQERLVKLQEKLNRAKEALPAVEQELRDIQNYPTSERFKQLQKQIESKQKNIEALEEKIERTQETIENIKAGRQVGGRQRQP